MRRNITLKENLVELLKENVTKNVSKNTTVLQFTLQKVPNKTGAYPGETGSKFIIKMNFPVTFSIVKVQKI